MICCILSWLSHHCSCVQVHPQFLFGLNPGRPLWDWIFFTSWGDSLLVSQQNTNQHQLQWTCQALQKENSWGWGDTQPDWRIAELHVGSDWHIRIMPDKPWEHETCVGGATEALAMHPRSTWPGVELYTKLGSGLQKGDKVLDVFRCGRGSSSVES